MTGVAIIGAGPYGLSIAAHLRGLGVPYRIFGRPLDTWQHHMPSGMVLKSDGFASNLSAPAGEGTLADYCLDRGISYHPTGTRVPLEVFNAYALAFQRRFVPDVDTRHVGLVERSGKSYGLTLDDGETCETRSVVVAAGITHFAQMPPELEDLSPRVASHSSAHHDLSKFAGKNVAVIGGGASAVELAVLAHEAGANASLITRRQHIRFDSQPSLRPRGRWQRMRHPSSGMGPGWRSWFFQNAPYLFRLLPRRARVQIVRRHLGPKSAWHLKARLESGVNVSVGERIEHATEEHGRVRLVMVTEGGGRRELLTDHVVAATGYWPDVRRLTFLSEEIRAAVRTHRHIPLVSTAFESSVNNLYFVGLSAAGSFGPPMRFMVGAEYVAPRLARRLARGARHAEARARAIAPA